MSTVTISDLQHKMVEIDRYKTTFWVLKVDNQLFRIDFLQKRTFEFKLKKRTPAMLSYFEKHPLLMDYNESCPITYINSKPENVDAFINDFKQVIDEMTEGWRHWTHYVVDKSIGFKVETFVNNLKKGRGKLVRAPFTMTQKILEVCAKHQVATSTFGNELHVYDFKLMLIGEHYMIAKAFQVRSVA
jgi:hypothetical protein